jgi:hypothetical protein
MPASSSYFQGTLDMFLPLDLGEVSRDEQEREFLA